MFFKVNLLLIDAHLHTVYSRHGNLKIKDIFKIYNKKGIIPAITEHNTSKPWEEAEYYSRKYCLPFIKGEEIKVYHNGSIVGELLGLFMVEQVEPGDIFQVIDSLKSQQALISVAHPYDVFRRPVLKGFTMLEQIKRLIDAVEIFNSRCLLSSANKNAENFARQNHLAFTAGTDAHFSCELGNAFLIVDADTPENARKKILKGQCSWWGRRSPLRAHLYTRLAKIHLM